MTRQLREAEAWREIARRIAEREQMRFGLCDQAWLLYETGRQISLGTYWAMYDRVRHNMKPFRTYAYPPGTHREERILAAIWLALEAEEEESHD